MRFLREITLSFIRVHVLYHALRERIFGLELIQELARHGYSIGPGTLYPLLHAMEREGYLVSDREVVGGKMRKYYRATAEGAQAMQELRHQIAELAHEVLEQADDGHAPGK